MEKCVKSFPTDISLFSIFSQKKLELHQIMVPLNDFDEFYAKRNSFNISDFRAKIT